ncbi:hypothetical protein EV126DRAFT_417839 [Verticillium dahliae]|nr:hypothetical protein EV126DRAFT_417839 [Verticillium dahliae]
MAGWLVDKGRCSFFLSSFAPTFFFFTLQSLPHKWKRSPSPAVGPRGRPARRARIRLGRQGGLCFTQGASSRKVLAWVRVSQRKESDRAREKAEGSLVWPSPRSERSGGAYSTLTAVLALSSPLEVPLAAYLSKLLISTVCGPRSPRSHRHKNGC